MSGIVRVRARAMVLGPTGAAGSEIVRQCLEDARFESVLAVSRRPLSVSHPKLSVVILSSFDDFSSIAGRTASIDVCFCALGVSSVTVRHPLPYRTITHDYVLAAARILAEGAAVARVCHVSARESDPNSRRMHVRVKGETERDLREVLGDKLIVFRPGYIHPVVPRDEPLWHDRLFGPLMFLRPLFPAFVTDTVELARAMIHGGLSATPRAVYDNRGIHAAAVEYMRTLVIPAGGV